MGKCGEKKETKRKKQQAPSTCECTLTQRMNDQTTVVNSYATIFNNHIGEPIQKHRADKRTRERKSKALMGEFGSRLLAKIFPKRFFLC